jgi:pimeloyl-ACP methyl ester carboxylesterase
LAADALVPEPRFYSSAGLRLHYVVWGDETKEPVVLVHGGRDHARSWDFVAKGLVDRFCVYALDLRGHGDSGWAAGGNYRLTDHVLDLAKLVKVLDRGPVNLIAHSMGGRVALDYAGAFPGTVARLCAIEGFGWPASAARAGGPPALRLANHVKNVWRLEEREEHVYPTIDAATQRMAEANRRLTPAMVDHLTRYAVRAVQGGYVWKFDHFIRLERPIEWTPQESKDIWRGVSCPLLLVWGGDSNLRFPMRDELLKTWPQARSVTFENAGHWVHHDELGDFVALVRDFMS